nr:membrane metallo-endopeptidase-like 1 [Dermacentor andersoni]
MIHGFDRIGRNFDEEGRMADWWSLPALLRFIRKSTCFTNQYSSVFSELANTTLNGVNTLGENMADNGGLRMAFRTLDQQLKAFDTPDVRLPGLEQYSAKHLFFLSTAFVSFHISSLVNEATKFMSVKKKRNYAALESRTTLVTRTLDEAFEATSPEVDGSFCCGGGAALAATAAGADGLPADSMLVGRTAAGNRCVNSR